MLPSGKEFHQSILSLWKVLNLGHFKVSISRATRSVRKHLVHLNCPMGPGAPRWAKLEEKSRCRQMSLCQSERERTISMLCLEEHLKNCEELGKHVAATSQRCLRRALTCGQTFYVTGYNIRTISDEFPNPDPRDNLILVKNLKPRRGT